MSVHIQLDQAESRCYTNLDFVSGTVVLILPQDATISAITVKLEGESRTRLAGPKFPNNERSEKKRTELEYHKVGMIAYRQHWRVRSHQATAFVQSAYSLPYAGTPRKDFWLGLYSPCWTVHLPLQIQGWTSALA